MTSVTVGRDEALVRELLAGYAADMRAGDADALVARYASGAVSFSLAPPLVSGDVGDADALRAWFATFDGPVDYEIRDLRVTVGGDVAFCHSVNRMSATPRGASESFDLWFRSTVCAARVDGVWQVAHEHTSVPFYMDGSLRAAVDLRPEGVA
jgi:ketosteroid isomerase-like protein